MCQYELKTKEISFVLCDKNIYTFFSQKNDLKNWFSGEIYFSLNFKHGLCISHFNKSVRLGVNIY